MPISVPITRPQLAQAEVDAVERVIRSGWVTQGPEVAAFEAEFAAGVGAEHAVAVSNCTVALELSLRCLGVAAGDEVVTVSHSFIATANAVMAVGATPVFVDVELDNYGMDPSALEAAITSRCRAILCVHQIGIPCDVTAIVAIAAKRGLPVIEDAACALGSEIELAGRWERVGKPRGILACFSFHPRKIVTTGDGGMMTTADPILAARLRSLRQHGVLAAPATGSTIAFEQYVEPGFNHRMTDLQAALGRPQLSRLDEIVAERRALAACYAEELSSNVVFATPRPRANVRCNWQSYPLTIRPEAKVQPIEAMRFLLDRGVSVRRGVGNAHQEPAYARWTGRPLPVSEHLRDHTVLIPLFHGMREDEQQAVISACKALGARA